MPESSPAACRFAIRDKAAFCALPGGLLNIDSALTLISFAGRDDADVFFFVIFVLQAIDVDNQQQRAGRPSYGVPPLFARYDAVLAEDCMGIVEYKSRALKTEAVVFLFVDPVLFSRPIRTASLYKTYNIEFGKSSESENANRRTTFPQDRPSIQQAPPGGADDKPQSNRVLI